MENLFLELLQAVKRITAPVLEALSPLLIGLLLAYLLYPAAAWIEKRTGRRWSIFFTYLGLCAALAGMSYGFLVLISGSLPTGNFREITDMVRIYFEQAGQSLANFAEQYIPGSQSAVGHAADWLKGWVIRQIPSASAADDLISRLTGGAVRLFLGVIVSVYLLNDREYFLLLGQKFLSMHMKQKAHGIVCETADEIHRVLSAFLKGILVDGLIVAFLSSAVLAVLGVEYAVVLGLLMGVLNVIPYFGPFIGMIPAFLTALAGGGILKAIAAILGLFLVQQIDGDFIYPHIVGSTTGLHPLFVLLAVSISGCFFGLIGMVAAVPVAGIIQILIRRQVLR
ncbi:MAG: AI-2E family transporter [Firmicutes bacterium]|nr:AI-2E family transporter [Bacillota bacterium]MDD7602069.1 AI-2E family transporter [Bacillota bacterium]MDY5855391.1 AI-2E family transporter [Anaerovoracaceae bacterium]